MIILDANTSSSRYLNKTGSDFVSVHSRSFQVFIEPFFSTISPKFHWQRFKAAATSLEFEPHVNHKPQGLCALLAKLTLLSFCGLRADKNISRRAEVFKPFGDCKQAVNHTFGQIKKPIRNDSRVLLDPVYLQSNFCCYYY